MSLNSVNTNMGAMVALQSLESTQTQLSATEKQISTGYRVADSTDDGAAYAIAQGIRSTVGVLTTANQQLGGVQGLLSTTNSGLNAISNLMSSMRDTLLNLSSNLEQGTQRTDDINKYQSLLANVQTAIQDADYSGKTLIGDLSGSTGTFGRVAVARNESGSSYGIASFSGSTLYGSISFTSTQLAGASTVAALITATDATGAPSTTSRWQPKPDHRGCSCRRCPSTCSQVKDDSGCHAAAGYVLDRLVDILNLAVLDHDPGPAGGVEGEDVRKIVPSAHDRADD